MNAETHCSKVIAFADVAKAAWRSSFRAFIGAPRASTILEE
jgi:hypothetical protein